MLHLLRSLLSRISGQLPTLALFISPFSFLSYPTPPSACPLQLLRNCHSLVLHCSSVRKVGSRLRRLGEKPKSYFCQLIHLSSEFIYQTFIEHHSASPCDSDKGYRTEQGICVLLPSRGSQTCWKIEPQTNHYRVEQ